MNEGPEHHSVTREEVDAIMVRTSAAFALADAPVEISRTRSGTIGGLFATSVRGFAVTEVAVPIQFEFDSDVMTAEGEDSFKLMLAAILAENSASITLEGHTDPQGSEAYNMALSERRARAVQRKLQDGGYSGSISIVARGESELPPAHPPEDAGTEAHFEVARRVVLVR